jgi:hypothetical protein
VSINAYEKPSNVSQQTWDRVSPYFLPEDHPVKRKLDKIFQHQTVTRSSRTVEKAGFFNGKPGKYSQVVVSGHFDLEGYLVKLYLDSNTQVNDAHKFRERVVGAAAIKRVIEAYGFSDVVKVPKKWIYPIPSFSNSGVSPKRFVLVVEDMRPYSNDKSLSLWKKKITRRQLDAVWTILTVVGLPDCAYAFNIPFCRDGKLAFLDTEQSGMWPIHYERLKQYLSGDRLNYWIRLCQ